MHYGMVLTSAFVQGMQNGSLSSASRFACSGTGSRTPVSGVRGQRPRPLDDTTIAELRCKVTTFFLTTKTFAYFFQKKVQFLLFSPFAVGLLRILGVFFEKSFCRLQCNR